MAYFAAALFLFSLGLWPRVAGANQLYEIRPLAFGTFAVPPSGAARRIVVAPDGTETLPDGGVVKLANGHNAVFRISQLNPATLFYITVDPTTITHGSGTPSFDIDDFTFDPPSDAGSMIHTDPDASLMVNIGGTLHIAPGTPHKPGAYRGTYTFMLNF